MGLSDNEPLRRALVAVVAAAKIEVHQHVLGVLRAAETKDEAIALLEAETDEAGRWLQDSLRGVLARIITDLESGKGQGH